MMTKMMLNKHKSLGFIDWSEFAVFSSAVWITTTLLISPVFRIPWFAPGDFDHPTAMYYHGIMLPALVFLYLLTRNVLGITERSTGLYEMFSMVMVLLVGFSSILNIEGHFAVVSAVQIMGMLMVDFLGIVLAVGLAIGVLKNDEKAMGANVGFLLLFCSILAVAAAALLGHLAGWLLDFGTDTVPGLNKLFYMTGMGSADFQENLVTSHSHIIVTAFLSALAGLTALCFHYQSLPTCKKRICLTGLWMTLSALLAATFIYSLSAVTGWEPPTLFVREPNDTNGMPLDDVVLTMGLLGLIVLGIGLWGNPQRLEDSDPFNTKIRTAAFVNWICLFVGSVILGVYIEFSEVFYGGGAPPAQGALSGNIFIRAHLLLPFSLLPALSVFLLAVGEKHHRKGAIRIWAHIFVWTSFVGMCLSLIGEFA